MTLYELAFHLKMPVYRLLDEMPYDELLNWLAYLNMRPVDWRDDDRTFKLLQAQGFKGKPQDVFMSLAVIYESQQVDGNTKGLVQSAFFQKMMSSKNGDRLIPVED